MSFQKSTSKVSLGLVVLGSGLPVTAQAATLPVEVPALNQDILNTIDTVSDDSVLEIESDSDIPVLSTDPESSVEPGFSHKNSQIGNDATLPISSESTSEAISYADLESNIVVDPEIDTESIFSITEQITTIQNSSQDVPNLLNEQVESSVVESEPSAFQESEDILVAQILPDTTLGDETSVVTSDVLIDGELADQIDGGAVRGTNLFHSFEEFNVDTGQRVYFENSSGINNILTRVTGENISNIDGVLGVNGPANFFIVNPNGVIFGPNAALDVRGAFSVSTTESIPFSDGSEFGAANISQTPMLSVSVPLGVQSGNNSIETSRTDINGDILLQEGSEIIWPSDNTLTFLASQDIRLSNNSKIKSTNGGNINFITESLELISGSQITANTSNLEDSGKINIVANEHITVSGNSSYIESSVNSNASGNSGGVEIITDSLSVIDGGAIITNTLGSGDSGLLHITSRDNINIAGQGSILTSRVRTNAIGNSGGI
ncbi:MAG: filamentous hemagglutinin N-terminal domain-containing protein, partial [Bacteroidota bacterium]